MMVRTSMFDRRAQQYQGGLVSNQANTPVGLRADALLQVEKDKDEFADKGGWLLQPLTGCRRPVGPAGRIHDAEARFPPTPGTRPEMYPGARHLCR